MKLGGCQVVIKCDGKTIREVNPRMDGDDDKAIVCFIPSQPGKEFWIEYNRSLNYGPPNTELTADVYFGGVFDGGWIPPDPSPRAKKVTGDIWGSRRGNKLHNFTFSKPELIDGETPSSVDPELIGDIKVVLGFSSRSEWIEKIPKQTVVDLGPPKVNERDKKLGVHCAGALLGEPSEECTQPIFVGDLAYEDALKFVFQCRAEEWLQAEGYIRKRRRQGGDPGPVEDPRVEPFPKPEPVEEAIHVNEIVMDGLEAIPAAGSPPRSRPPIYADEGPVAQPGETTHSALRPTGQEETRAEPDFITLERPRKIAKRSGNSMFTISDENASTVIGVHSVHQHSVEESGSRPMVKLEEKVKVEVKMEEGGAIPKVKEELEAAEKELEEQISKLIQKRETVRREMATLRTPEVQSEIRSRPKIKTERVSGDTVKS